MQKKLKKMKEGDSFTQLLSKEDSNLDTSIIMYAEQLARKDVEINTLRAKVLTNLKTIINVLKKAKRAGRTSPLSPRETRRILGRYVRLEGEV